MNEIRARAVLAGICLSLAAATFAYRILVWGHLEQTAALFIGLPLILSLAIIFCVPRPRSVTAMVTAIIALALTMGGMLWGEGFICIVMMSPLFFTVGVAIALPIDHRKREDRSKGFPVLPPTDKDKLDKTLGIVILALIPLTFEGTTSSLSLPQEEVVIASEVLPATPAEIEASLAQTPHFTTPLPLYLRLGFPQPVETSGSGLAVGNCEIHFANGEGAPGDLLLQVQEHLPNHIRFQFLSDTSHVAHWLAWERSDVQWSPVDAHHTRVTWTLRYRRLLHPSWYFKPWERYAVGLTAHYLIENLATPGSSP